MKFCQPSASQSKSTQTRPSSLGSRKVCEPLDPCCFRFSRLVVVKTLHQRLKSSTFDVARNNSLSSSWFSAAPLDADGAASLSPGRPAGIGRTPPYLVCVGAGGDGPAEGML